MATRFPAASCSAVSRKSRNLPCPSLFKQATFNRSSHMIRDFHESDQSDPSDPSDQSDSLSVLGQVSLVSQKHKAHDTTRNAVPLTRSRPGDQNNHDVFFQNPGEKKTENPSGFSKQISSFFKKTKNHHVQIIVNHSSHLMFSEISYSKSCVWLFEIRHRYKDQRPKISIGFWHGAYGALKPAAHRRGQRNGPMAGRY